MYYPLLAQGFTSLNRQRQQALNSLMKAKQTLAQIESRQLSQKQGRSNLTNQRRGLPVSAAVGFNFIDRKYLKLIMMRMFSLFFCNVIET